MTEMRKCIGSAKFAIVAHQAPVADFPAQPSQKGGLGRMCKPHWTEYTRALRKAALARQAADGGVATEAAPTEPEPAAVAARKGVGGRRAREARAAKPEAIKVRKAKAVVAATEALAGEAHLEAVGSDEVQAALEVIAGERIERIIA